MKINHNMMAVVTNAQLLRTENGLSASMERLASGLKINNAKDDPAGMAIGNKMQAQIDGLGQASQNASNGISVLQIADSALGEVVSMLQRMRELSVQAATDTNTQTDREAMQAEIDSLKDEVDRISRDTEYNTKKLLDGSSDTRVYADGVSRMTVTEAVNPGNYVLNITAAAAQAEFTSAATQTGTIPEGSISINGIEVSISAGEDASAVFAKLRDAAEIADVELTSVGGTGAFAYGDSLQFTSYGYGYEAVIDIQCSNDDIKNFLGLDMTSAVNGKNMEIAIDYTSSFGSQATVATDGNRITVTDVSGFEMDFMVEAGKTGALDIEVTDIGLMTLQIGANEHQIMNVKIPEISCDTLYLDFVDVTKVDGGSKAILRLDEAIETASAARSAIGAYQNRLEYAVESLNASEEDMTTAISRIQDVDMAKEMTEYTKYNVLSQAGTSVLAQANDVPQMVLQLLQ